MRAPDRFLFLKQNINFTNNSVLAKYGRRENVFNEFDFYFSDSQKFVYREKKHVAILGYGIFIDLSSSSTNVEIIDRLSESKSLDELILKTFEIAGRWVIFCKFNSNIFIIGDASNTKQIFYYKHDSNCIVSSFEYEIANLFSLKESDQARKFFNEFVSGSNWWPGDVTMFEEVRALLPNHYLDVSTISPVRFYPNSKMIPVDYDDALKKCGAILKSFFASLVERYECALPVTGGIDSRLLFAASYSWRNKIHYFVSAHTSEGVNHEDVLTPVQLFKNFGLSFTVLQNTYEHTKIYEKDFKNLFPEAELERVNYFFPCNKAWPKGVDIVLEGPINEVGSRYYTNRVLRVTPESLCDIAGMPSDFAKRAYKRWLDNALPSCNKTGYDIMDLFYWEHRTGRWVGKIANEFEAGFEPLYAFNLRGYLDLCLRLKSKRKNFPERKFYQDLTNYLCPECGSVSYAVNSTLLSCFTNMIRRTWLEKYFRVIFYFLRAKFPRLRNKSF